MRKAKYNPGEKVWHDPHVVKEIQPNGRESRTDKSCCKKYSEPPLSYIGSPLPIFETLLFFQHYILSWQNGMKIGEKCLKLNKFGITKT